MLTLDSPYLFHYVLIQVPGHIVSLIPYPIPHLRFTSYNLISELIRTVLSNKQYVNISMPHCTTPGSDIHRTYTENCARWRCATWQPPLHFLVLVSTYFLPIPTSNVKLSQPAAFLIHIFLSVSVYQGVFAQIHSKLVNNSLILLLSDSH